MSASVQSLQGVVRRRRAYRVVVDEEGVDVVDEMGTQEYVFDFELWVPNGEATFSSGIPPNVGASPKEKVHVFMQNHVADCCQTIKPGDKVKIIGRGLTFTSAPPSQSDDIDRRAHVEMPCQVHVWRSLPNVSGDFSTQVAYQDTFEDMLQERASLGSSPAPAASPPPSKRTRRARRSKKGGYTYTELAGLSLGTANFFGVVVGTGFPRKTSRDFLAT